MALAKKKKNVVADNIVLSFRLIPQSILKIKYHTPNDMIHRERKKKKFSMRGNISSPTGEDRYSNYVIEFNMHKEKRHY